MKIQMLVILTMVTFFVGCRNSATEPQSDNLQELRNLTVLEKAVVSSDNSFGLKLFSRISSDEPDKNVFISPFSVSMALGMTLNGADGATLDSIKKVLENSNFTIQEINESYKNISYILTHLDPDVVFQIANSIWYDNGFTVKQTFIDDCRTYFNAEAASLDFFSPVAVQTINNWVSLHTNGKIPEIIDKIPPGTLMYLINAIYFKGNWTYPFDTAKTINAMFTTDIGNEVPCMLMEQRSTYAYKEMAGARIVDLPYGDKSFSMTIVLPDEGIDIDQFAAGLTQQQWDMMMSGMDSTEIDLYLPKFKLEYDKSIRDELIAMGMGIAFGGGADFSRIAGGIFIDDVVHKTFVEVNEEGTEAAAVTIISFIRGILTPTMRVDRPFIFAIREHQSGTILFIGKIVNPVS